MEVKLMGSILMRKGFEKMMNETDKYLIELSSNLGTRINDKQREDIRKIIGNNRIILNEVIEYL